MFVTFRLDHSTKRSCKLASRDHQTRVLWPAHRHHLLQRRQHLSSVSLVPGLGQRTPRHRALEFRSHLLFHVHLSLVWEHAAHSEHVRDGSGDLIYNQILDWWANVDAISFHSPCPNSIIPTLILHLHLSSFLIVTAAVSKGIGRGLLFRVPLLGGGDGSPGSDPAGERAAYCLLLILLSTAACRLPCLHPSFLIISTTLCSPYHSFTFLYNFVISLVALYLSPLSLPVLRGTHK